MITKKGTIVKKSGDKTVKVLVSEFAQHPKYKKRYTKTSHILVHDEQNKGVVGEEVTIAQDRKVSKKKSWILTTTK